MKIELDVNAAELTKSLSEILSSLTPEQRVQIATETMQRWLREPYDAERQAREAMAVESVKQEMAKSGYRQETDSEIRNGYRFRQFMEGFKSTKEVMVKEITLAVIDAYKTEVKKVVESDPKIQAMKDEVVAILKEKFPEAVHDAMVTWMASSMENMFKSTMGIERFAQRVQDHQNYIQSRIAGVEQAVQARMH